jgi:hypothetical protein
MNVDWARKDGGTDRTSFAPRSRLLDNARRFSLNFCGHVVVFILQYIDFSFGNIPVRINSRILPPPVSISASTQSCLYITHHIIICNPLLSPLPSPPLPSPHLQIHRCAGGSGNPHMYIRNASSTSSALSRNVSGYLPAWPGPVHPIALAHRIGVRNAPAETIWGARALASGGWGGGS